MKRGSHRLLGDRTKRTTDCPLVPCAPWSFLDACARGLSSLKVQSGERNAPLMTNRSEALAQVAGLSAAYLGDDADQLEIGRRLAEQSKPKSKSAWRAKARDVVVPAPRAWRICAWVFAQSVVDRSRSVVIEP
jgi:hypothetical protein